MNVAKSMNEGLQRRDEYDGTVTTVFICIIHYFIEQHKEYGICVNNMQQIILRVILSCSLSPSLSLSLSLLKQKFVTFILNFSPSLSSQQPLLAKSNEASLWYVPSILHPIKQCQDIFGLNMKVIVNDLLESHQYSS